MKVKGLNEATKKALINTCDHDVELEHDPRAPWGYEASGNTLGLAIMGDNRIGMKEYIASELLAAGGSRHPDDPLYNGLRVLSTWSVKKDACKTIRQGCFGRDVHHQSRSLGCVLRP